MRFVDTNVLLYAIARDPAEADKARIAGDLLSERDLAISVQVLQEFYVQATRATRDDRLTHAQAAGLAESFLRFQVQAITVPVMRDALDTHQRFGISYWDAAILAAARAAGCDSVLSEDLDDTTDYEGVRVENPFRPA